MAEDSLRPPPSSILIVGAGVFGLSTTLAFLTSSRYAHTHLTLLDSRTPIPTTSSKPPFNHNSSTTSLPSPTTNPLTASLDSSRIIRADYAVPAYADLAASAQQKWREGFGGEGVYRESGLCFVAGDNGSGGSGGKEADGNDGDGKVMDGEGYVRQALANMQALNPAAASKLEFLPDRAAIDRIMAPTTGGGSGAWGYVNWSSGWADATAAIETTRRTIAQLGQTHPGGMSWVHGHASRLLLSPAPGPPPQAAVCTGVALAGPQPPLHAALTILATGAWAPALLPRELAPRIAATGQCVAYVQLSRAEAARLARMPVLLNESDGMFVIPPTEAHVLKIARHGFGYRNPVAHRVGAEGGSGVVVEASVPAGDFATLPAEGAAALRGALGEMVPWLRGREFAATRVCWYADTAMGDFLVDWVPGCGETLLVATGGSGHGFKFLPVLGGKVVERVEGRLGGELGGRWAWGEGRAGVWECGDGSRGGRRGMVWGVEVERGRGEIVR